MIQGIPYPQNKLQDRRENATICILDEGPADAAAFCSRNANVAMEFNARSFEVGFRLWSKNSSDAIDLEGTVYLLNYGRVDAAVCKLSHRSSWLLTQNVHCTFSFRPCVDSLLFILS